VIDDIVRGLLECEPYVERAFLAVMTAVAIALIVATFPVSGPILALLWYRGKQKRDALSCNKK
jgi:hypothetical protein